MSKQINASVVAQLTGQEEKANALFDERDYLRERLDKVEDKADEKRERHTQRIAELEARLEEERAKSWWQKLRGK